MRRFVIVSGLPGSGKTTLARRLAPALGLTLIDKDDILERLFYSRGVGNGDHRRTLSRESDVVLQAEAEASAGAVIVSFWRRPGMPDDSGTPTTWLSSLSSSLVEVHCACPPEIAASRFLRRRRHPGHLDRRHTFETLFAALEAQSRLTPLDLGERIDVDTSRELSVDDLVRDVEAALERNSKAAADLTD
jgi:glucokinase